MPFDPDRPYNDLPDLPPVVELETRAVTRRTTAAARALAELKGSGAVVPDQRVLINSLVLQEARASSEIENIVTTSDEIHRALEHDPMASSEAREVVRYREALWTGYEMLRTRPLSTNMFIEIASIIRQVDAQIRRNPGTRIQSSAGNVIYTPPDGENRLRAKLANLENFIHGSNDLDPLVKLAVLHYQFEAIHPFTDGNGRTGRILCILFLIHAGLLELPILYLSGYIIRNKNEYYQGLRKVTEQNAWESWLIYMLDAVESTARDTREKISGIQKLIDAAVERVRVEAPGIYSKELIEEIFRRPYCKIRFVQDACGVTRQTASTYLRKLESLGLLDMVAEGKEKYYVNRTLWQLLSGQTSRAQP
ncbi:MAG TPA: Fic family protein [Armatimonadota bacterium]|nr:Fic family protein [Armatimonadota bacterium]